MQIAYSLVPLFMVKTTPEKVENAALFLQLSLSSTLIRRVNEALFLWLGLPSTLIRHEKDSLSRKRFFISMVRPTVHPNL